MGLTNTLRKQVDLPTWEQLRFAPLVSSAISCAASPDNSHFHPEFGRYIYYLISAVSFWKYDTWTDTYVQLSSPPIAPVTWSSMKFSGAYGFEGRVLSAASGSITIPAYYGQVLKGFEVRIIAGTGRGQQRMITEVADAVVADSGVATTVSALGITDSTKAWTINQWAGYQVRVSYGTGVSQVRRILTNDATGLTLVDVARYAVDYQTNPAPPSPALATTAGAQTIYSIESSVVSVEDNWNVTPDATSRFRVFSGAIFLASSAALTPFYTFQVYDIASDTWYIRTSTTAIASAAGTDGALERTSENGAVWEKGIATGGTTTTLIDTAQQWEVNKFTGRWVRIYSGTGEGQIRQVASNTSTTLTWVTGGTAPDTTSRYLIDGFDAGTATSATSTTITDSTKAWVVDRWKNYAVRIVAGTGMGQAMPILSNTTTALTLYKPWATTPDNTSVYVLQGDKDNNYIFLGGQAGVVVHSFEADMATPCRGVDDGCARGGSAQYGDFPPIPITSGAGAAGTITVTTAIAHGFQVGWSITHRGDTGASAVQNNITATVASVPSATTYTYVAPGSTAAWTVAAQSTTTLKDASKNWTVNEHADKIVYFTTAAPAVATGLATCVAMEIASNTANTLTFKTVTTAPTNGVSRYIITTRQAIGALDSGIASGGSTTTLVDASKSWGVNIWAGRRLKYLSGAGQAVEISITSNTSTTLTFAATTAAVANSTSYSILGCNIRGLGLGAIWAFGKSAANTEGKYLYLPRGGAVHGFDRLNITTDLWDIMSISPQFETLTTGSMYAYDGGNRLYFTKEATQRLYYLDLDTNKVHGAGFYPYLAGTAIIGNRMEIFETEDGLKYLWLNRHSFTECYRQLLYF